MADVVDVAPGLLEEIEKDFKKQLKENKLVHKLLDKINKGKATYKEANEYAIELGEILARAYKKNLSSNVLPEGKMYFNIAKRIIEPTMKTNYVLITDVASQVQETLNKQAKIGIKPIKPKINQDRIDGIINRVSYEDNYDDVAWILDEPIVNYSQSIVDDSIKANAEFHYESGMEPKIQRISSGNCCEWCNKLVGSYSYPNVPKDVYRRHDNCRCTVDYVVGKKRTNIHGGNIGKRRYQKNKYGAYTLTKEARMKRAQELKETEKERKDAARKKRITTWQRKREEVNKLKNIDSITKNDKIFSGARILDPNDEYSIKWAKSYYEEIRHKSTDYKKIAKRMNISEDDVFSIKKYLFHDKVIFNPIKKQWERFYPDAAIAQSWQRLAEGEEIFKHDKTLINHEMLEMEIKKKNPSLSHQEAHELTNKSFNYSEEAREYYANLRKRNKKE